MTVTFLSKVEQAVREGLSISAIERKYGFRNRAIRRAKQHLYETGALPLPVGYKSKDTNGFNTD